MTTFDKNIPMTFLKKLKDPVILSTIAIAISPLSIAVNYFTLKKLHTPIVEIVNASELYFYDSAPFIMPDSLRKVILTDGILSTYLRMVEPSNHLTDLTNDKWSVERISKWSDLLRSCYRLYETDSSLHYQVGDLLISAQKNKIPLEDIHPGYLNSLVSMGIDLTHGTDHALTALVKRVQTHRESMTNCKMVIDIFENHLVEDANSPLNGEVQFALGLINRGETDELILPNAEIECSGLTLRLKSVENKYSVCESHRFTEIFFQIDLANNPQEIESFKKVLSNPREKYTVSITTSNNEIIQYSDYFEPL